VYLPPDRGQTLGNYAIRLPRALQAALCAKGDSQLSANGNRCRKQTVPACT